MKKIDIETHFLSKALYEALKSRREAPCITDDNICIFGQDCALPYGHMMKDLMDIGEGRIEKMDHAGIDVQFISCVGGVELLPSEEGEEVAKKSNDELAEAIEKYPERFRGYAILSPHNVDNATRELERCVKELGFIGWNAFSNFGKDSLDYPKYKPLLKKCEELGALVYIHPTMSSIDRLHGLGRQLIASGLGFGIDTMITAERIMLQGIFDEIPNLKVLLGHLGEGFPYIMDRMKIRGEMAKRLPAVNQKSPKDYLLTNFYIVTSGNYSEPALVCGKDSIGVERIFLGSDYPMEDLTHCVEFIENSCLTEIEKQMIFAGNIERVINNSL